jgi:hypothetical protein
MVGLTLMLVGQRRLEQMLFQHIAANTPTKTVMAMAML